MRLEPEVWDALWEICQRERWTVGALVTRAREDFPQCGRTSAVRVFVLGSFREAATETGHIRAGHCRLTKLWRQQLTE